MMSGGIECVINAMRKHPDNTQILVVAGSVLTNVAATPTCIDLTIASGGVACLVDAMHRHTQVREVQAMACQAVYNLSTKPDYAVQIAESGVCVCVWCDITYELRLFIYGASV